MKTDTEEEQSKDSKGYQANRDGPALKKRLADILEASIKSAAPYHIQLVVDASKSVNDTDYANAKLFAVNLVDNFDDDVTVSVIQFDNVDAEEQDVPYTVRRETAKKRLLAMRRSTRGTPASLALQAAAGANSVRAGSKDSKQVVFLFANDNLNDLNLSVRAGALLRDMDVDLVGIGVGQVDRARLEQVCGVGNVYIQADWILHRDTIPAACDINRRFVRGAEVTMSLKQTNTVIGFRDPLPLSIVITNIGDVDVTAGALVPIDAGDFYEQNVHRIKATIPSHGGEYNFHLTLQPTGYASIDTMPDTVFLKVIDPKTMLTYRSKYAGIVFPTDMLMGDVINWRPKYPDLANAVRILVFGYCGSGMSTLINHFLSLFGTLHVEEAPAFASDSRVTVENHLYRTREAPQINFLDTVGLGGARDNYSNEILRGIVEGTIPHSFRVGNEPIPDTRWRTQSAADEQREMHTAIVVVTCMIVHDSAEMQKRIRSYIQQLARLDMAPLLVVTRIDGVVDDDELRSLPDQVSRMTGLPSSRIFLLDNQPLAQDDPGLWKQRKVLFGILLKALESATFQHERMHRTAIARRRN